MKGIRLASHRDQQSHEPLRVTSPIVRNQKIKTNTDVRQTDEGREIPCDLSFKLGIDPVI
jgi:hypothetical protein